MPPSPGSVFKAVNYIDRPDSTQLDEKVATLLSVVKF